MNKELRDQYKARHQLLHDYLDELTNCFQREFPGDEMSETTVLELFNWSFGMIENSTCARTCEKCGQLPGIHFK